MELFGKDRLPEKNATTEKNDNSENEYLGNHILHPYLGFVNVPNDNHNRFCFPGIDPITKKSLRSVNICLMGGSVAMSIYGELKKQLIQDLAKASYFKDKEIELVLFALGGFKQPQQLIALNYFMSLGAQYDIVINLDGFNEIVLPYSDNLPFNVFPSYPRHWNIYSRKRFNSKVLLLLGKQAVIKEERNNLKSVFSNFPLRHSNLALFIWKVLDNKKNHQLLIFDSKLREALKQSESDYQSTGPRISIDDTTVFFDEQANLWKRASLQIGQLSQSAGFEYFHFLQPNQYFEGSKELTKEEMAIAYKSEPFAYKTAVRKGYPILIQKGRELMEKDIKFVDLTMIFKEEKRTVYNDKCCHFNELGYEIIADRISNVIVNYFENEITANNSH